MMMTSVMTRQRKIIHIDMDCFYAAIEIRDNPSLINKPVAVGGDISKRGVITTCNYVARKFGVRSAMPTARALQLCRDLILLPVNMPKYREVAEKIHTIFHEFTPLVEPLALDEAFLDVSHSELCSGSATLIAQEIRQQILARENLVASAGVAPNKFLAKIASGWKKPNGLFVITPNDVNTFVTALPISEIYGVGKVTAEKLFAAGIRTCGDLQKLTLFELTEKFGKLGQRLFYYCRGIDERSVEPNRIRKSLSVETTFAIDIFTLEQGVEEINVLFVKLQKRIRDSNEKRPIKNQQLKIKFHDFKIVTSEMSCDNVNSELFVSLFVDLYKKYNKPVRLIGLGVHFVDAVVQDHQTSLF